MSNKIITIIIGGMVFHATFSYIVEFSFYWWKNGVPGENHRPVASHWQILSHNTVSSTPRVIGIRNHNVTKSNYHTITTTATPKQQELYSSRTMWTFILESKVLQVFLFLPPYFGIAKVLHIRFCFSMSRKGHRSGSQVHSHTSIVC